MGLKSRIGILDNLNLALLILRLFVGLRVIYGVIDNVLSLTHMKEFIQFLENNHFVFPKVMAFVSVYVQLVAGLCLLLGVAFRLSAAALTLNFLIAIVCYHLRIGDTIEGMTPAIAIFSICFALFFSGPGNFILSNFKKSSVR